MGYRPSIISEVSVTSSKEVFVEIPMDENVQDLAEVLVKPEIKKTGQSTRWLLQEGV